MVLSSLEEEPISDEARAEPSITITNANTGDAQALPSQESSEEIGQGNDTATKPTANDALGDTLLISKEGISEPLDETLDDPQAADSKPPPGAPAQEDEDEQVMALSETADGKRKRFSPTSPSLKNAKKRRRSNFPSFPEMLYLLMAFRCKYGHCRVPPTEQPLNGWCAFVRRAYNERKRGLPATYLTQERLDILNSINFTWSLLQSSNDQRWQQNFEKLLQFRTEKGHCNAPQSTPLGKWVQMQRDQYRERQLLESGKPTKKNGRPAIPMDRIQKLEAVGFSWRVAPPAVGWEGRFQELLDFKNKYGHCNVAQGWKENIQLGRWVMKQRVQYHKRQRGEKSQMTDERIKKLEDIGFGWVGAGKLKSSKLNKDDEGAEEDDEDEPAESSPLPPDGKASWIQI